MKTLPGIMSNPWARVRMEAGSMRQDPPPSPFPRKVVFRDGRWFRTTCHHRFTTNRSPMFLLLFAACTAFAERSDPAVL